MSLTPQLLNPLLPIFKTRPFSPLFANTRAPMILQLIIVSNVLARFPLHVKKTMITEVTSTLLVTSDLTLLSSMAHMKWAMEVLGQGFALPLEELSITQETTQLYSQWLFEPQMRPMAFRQAAGTADEQLLYQVRYLKISDA